MPNTWEYRYRYNGMGERESKREWSNPGGDGTAPGYAWTYYLLGGTKEQLSVWQGIQTSQSGFCGDTGGQSQVYFYPTEYLTYGVSSVNITTHPNGTQEYRITDHLGSNRVTLDNTGSVVTTTDYAPFGGAIAGVPPRKGFIDKERDGEHGLGNFGVRAYDYDAGRFTSIDPLLEKMPAWSPYHYGHNSPITRLDPSGEWDITVHASENRTDNPLAIAIVRDRNGNEVYRFKVKVVGQHRDRMKEDGDTPFGVYDIEDNITWYSHGSRTSYGPNPRLVLTTLSGEARESGRSEIRIHGGRQEDAYGGNSSRTLEELPSTRGCLRAMDDAMKTLKSLTDKLEQNDSEETPGILTVTADPVPSASSGITGSGTEPTFTIEELLNIDHSGSIRVPTE